MDNTLPYTGAEVQEMLEGSMPDWNASKTQKGYIKNKPLRIIDANGGEYVPTHALNMRDFTAVPDENGEVYTYIKQVDFDSLLFVLSNKRPSAYGVISDCAFYPVDYTSYGYRVALADNLAGNVSVRINEDDYTMQLTVAMDFADTFFPDDTVYIVSSYEDGVSLEQLPDAFIPSSIARTSQISGFDITFWKYLKNPVIIRDGNAFPKDLCSGQTLGEAYITYSASSLYAGADESCIAVKVISRTTFRVFSVDEGGLINTEDYYVDYASSKIRRRS